MSFWANHVLPILVEKGCRSSVILEERRRWIPHAHGQVLELGVGSGLNLAFYDAARVAKVTGIDPSAPLLARAGARAAGAPVPVELVEAPAEALPFDAGSFDSAVVTYSLCSMADPARAPPRRRADVRRARARARRADARLAAPADADLAPVHGWLPSRSRHRGDPAGHRVPARRVGYRLHRRSALAELHVPGHRTAGVTTP